jgi:excisionase family DNA binding protein
MEEAILRRELAQEERGLREMLTVRETANRLGLQECTIRAWLAARKIDFVRLGRAVRIPESEVCRLIEANTVPRREPRR